MNDTTASVSHEEFDELRDALVAVADQRDLIRKRLRATIAEWREMGEEKIVADTAANVIEQDLLTPVVTPPFERMHAASPREIEQALRIGGWDSGPIDPQSVIVAAVNGVLGQRRADPTQADSGSPTPSGLRPSVAPEGNDAHALLDRAWGLIANASNGEWRREGAEWQEAAVEFGRRYAEHQCRRRAQDAHPPSASPQSAPEGNPAEPGIYPAWISDDEGAHCDCAMWDGEFWRVWCDAFDPPEWDQIENLNSRVIRWTTPDRSLAPPQADANAIPLRAAPCAPPEGLDVVPATMEMARHCALQPCARYDDTECVETEDCVTEFCWPCRFRVALNETQADAQAHPPSASPQSAPEGQDAPATEATLERAYRAFIKRHHDDETSIRTALRAALEAAGKGKA